MTQDKKIFFLKHDKNVLAEVFFNFSDPSY